jgi:hypothetical protein
MRIVITTILILVSLIGKSQTWKLEPMVMVGQSSKTTFVGGSIGPVYKNVHHVFVDGIVHFTPNAYTPDILGAGYGYLISFNRKDSLSGVEPFIKASYFLLSDNVLNDKIRGFQYGYGIKVKDGHFFLRAGVEADRVYYIGVGIFGVR